MKQEPLIHPDEERFFRALLKLSDKHSVASMAGTVNFYPCNDHEKETVMEFSWDGTGSLKIKSTRTLDYSILKALE